MAKKNSQNDERRARVEQLRAQQARQERRRSLVILGACVVVVIGLLSAALIPFIQDQREEDRVKALGVAKIGVSESAAGCDDILKRDADGNGNHQPVGTKIAYEFGPPAFGPHWGNFLQGAEIRNFWTPEDRPELERVVHSLEHGHTFLWYDAALAKDSADYQTLQNLADKFSDDPYFNIVPWKAEDGKAFPAGKKFALAHWTGPKNQEGVWQYCSRPSGQVVEKFVDTYTPANSPEPGAP